MKRRVVVSVFSALLLLGVPSVARANAGVPMIALLWPAAWVLLLPIIFLEAYVAKRVLAMQQGTAVRMSARANLVSTFAGIPLTWLVLFLLEVWVLNSGLAGDGRTRPSPLVALLLLPLMAPLGVRMFPSEDQDWDLVAAAMWLCAMFFLVSVWLEARVVAWRSGYLDPRCPPMELASQLGQLWSDRSGVDQRACLDCCRPVGSPNKELQRTRSAPVMGTAALAAELSVRRKAEEGEPSRPVIGAATAREKMEWQ
jgi:hypothetical protein